jgi:hypothetical protein
MRPRIAVFVAALSLTIAAVAAAQAMDAGTIIRLDPQASVVMLEGGRMYRVTPSTVLLVDNRPTSFKSLRPGERVSIQDGEPVLYRDRRYIALKPAPGPAVAQTPPPAQGPPVATEALSPASVRPPVMTETPSPTPARPSVVTEAPASVAVPAPSSTEAVVTAEPLTVRRTIYGTVTDVGSDGKVKIKTDGDPFEARVSPDALREINKGDNVVIHFSISPPGATSPR